MSELTDKSEGMSLHNYFAAAALQGILSNPSLIDSLCPENLKWVAEKSQEMADQMIFQVR
ncbi:hypothetical protein PS2_257 [Serratia phage PS2]|uniref:Uncharacterized protein n=1 Tax=Serratia phage PS2 TaxID=1481112 RepID=A0A023W5E9_9CAUD|nr:hypothetical protein FF83_gp158 [Serratia phage PS2]AHY25495.1 hypothetical protein PS2_257 [Serratia phage PS2]WDS61789.1 hypothetical protein [Cronobacter phage vB_Cdu_VP8]